MADANTKAKPASKSIRSKKLAVMSEAIDTTLAQTPVVQVPFSTLEKSPLNVRTVPYPAESVAQLADTIATVGLLQNLVVHTLPDGKYGVAAGGRRLAAIHLLVERGSYAPDDTIPVKIVADDIARAVSLIENEQHLKMHPAEQIVGFRALAAEGKTPEQIGDLMGYSSRHVQRCLKLANLDTSLLKELAEDAISLEQCQMLALENDQERQVQVWEQARQYYNGTGVPPAYLRNKIVSDELLTGSGLFRFVGEAAYEAAGGVIRRDLFSNDESSWADRLLTETLALKKLEVHAQQVMAEEGWSWCESRLSAVRAFGTDSMAWQLNMPDPVYTQEEEARLTELDAELEGCTTHDDENAIQQEIEDIENAAQERLLTPDFKHTHGIFVSLDDGEFTVQRGVLRVVKKDDDEDNEEATTAIKGITHIAPPPEKADAYSATLVKAMSSERTLAVQAALAGDPQVSVALLTWTMCRSIFMTGYSKTPNPLKFSLHNSQYALISNALSGENGMAFQAMQSEVSEIKKTLPEGWQDDFTRLLDLPQESVLRLLGFCVAFGIDGVQERLYNRTDRSPLEGLEAALNFDLREWWQPTAEGYFCKLSRNQICEALTEAGFSGRARDAMKMKRGDAATAAAEAISSTRWVPDWMTRPQPQESDTQNDSTVTGLNETDHAA